MMALRWLMQKNFIGERFQYAYINFPLHVFWILDAATLKKRLQIRIVGQERDNALIVSWNDTSPGSSVSIEMILQSYSRADPHRFPPFYSLLAEVSHDETKVRDRRETSAGFRHIFSHSCTWVSLTTSDVFVTCDTTHRTGLHAKLREMLRTPQSHNQITWIELPLYRQSKQKYRTLAKLNLFSGKDSLTIFSHKVDN